MNPLDWLRGRSDGFWVTVAILAVIVSGAAVTVIAVQRPGFRDWLIADESGSTTIRNFGLLVGGIVAIVLAVWRSRVAERQAAAAQRQAEIALKQAATAERGLLNERYQKGAEMLGSDVFAVRLGGIYALQRLADEHPDQYHVQIMRLFCAFARNPTADKNLPNDPNAKVREDVQTIMNAIGARSEHHLEIERKSLYWPDLPGVYLRCANLQGENLSSTDSKRTGPWTKEDKRAPRWRTDLSGANLHGAVLTSAQLNGSDFSASILTKSYLTDADLSGADLECANLSGALLTDASLSDAFLVRAVLSGSDLTAANLCRTWFSIKGGDPARGLTQSQLDSALADPDHSPVLDGVPDADTGKPLEWHGGLFDDEADVDL